MHLNTVIIMMYWNETYVFPPRTGPIGWAFELLSERTALPALLAEPGVLLLGSPALPHPSLGLPAALLPSSLSAVLTVLFPRPGHGIPAFTGALPVHQLAPPAPPAPAGLALPALALRGRRATVSVPPRVEFRPASRVSRRPAAPAPRPGRRSRGAGGSSSGDACNGASRAGGHSGEFSGALPTFMRFFFFFVECKQHNSGVIIDRICLFIGYLFKWRVSIFLVTL